jgi:nucleoside-diphosphate-sugar epimerase
VLRLPLTYGPRVKGNFLTLLDAVARCARLPFGRIANRRDLLYVGNLVHAIAGLLDAPDPSEARGSLPDGEAVSTAELVRRVASALGVAPRVTNVPAPLLSSRGPASGRGAYCGARPRHWKSTRRRSSGASDRRRSRSTRDSPRRPPGGVCGIRFEAGFIIGTRPVESKR